MYSHGRDGTGPLVEVDFEVEDVAVAFSPVALCRSRVVVPPLGPFLFPRESHCADCPEVSMETRHSTENPSKRHPI